MKAGAFTWLWALWLVSFVIVEAAAIAMNHGTLSSHVWYLLDRYLATRMLIVALFGWLMMHWFFWPRLAPAWVGSVLANLVAVFVFGMIGLGTRRRK